MTVAYKYGVFKPKKALDQELQTLIRTTHFLWNDMVAAWKALDGVGKNRWVWPIVDKWPKTITDEDYANYWNRDYWGLVDVPADDIPEKWPAEIYKNFWRRWDAYFGKYMAQHNTYYAAMKSSWRYMVVGKFRDATKEAFKGTRGFPRFRKTRNPGSLVLWVYPQHLSISEDNPRIAQVFLGQKWGWLKFKYHRPLPENYWDEVGYHVVMLSNDTQGKYYLTFMGVERDKPTHTLSDDCWNEAVGIDVGLCPDNLYAFWNTQNDNWLEDFPQWYQSAQKRRRQLARKLDRQRRANNPQNYNEDGTAKKGAHRWHHSKNYDKTLSELRRMEAKIARVRWQYYHELSDHLTRNYGLIALEDISLSWFDVGVHARAAHDAAFGMLRTMIEYKALERGGEVLYVDPAYTSQTCPVCGHQGRENRPTRDTFCCAHCDYESQADVVAARNVLHRALSRTGGLTIEDIRHIMVQHEFEVTLPTE